MRNRRDLSVLKDFIAEVTSNPRKDYDDGLFNTILSLAELEKEALISGDIIDNGKRYIKLGLDGGDGRYIRFRDLLLGFADGFASYDGFALGPVLIEKGFIEEIVSALDISSVSATIGQVYDFEGDVAVCVMKEVSEEPFFHCDYVLDAEVPDGFSPDRIAASSFYINALNELKDRDMHSIAFPGNPSFPGFSVKETAEIALSAVGTCLEVWSDYHFSVVFCCSGKEELEAYRAE